VKKYQGMFRAILIALPVLLLTMVSGVLADENPDDPAIMAAAEKAVERLGPDRGALALITDIRSIEGLEAAFHGRGLDLEGAIEDLNADVRENEIIVTLSADVLFDFDQAIVKPEAEPQLAKLATILREKENSRTTIVGHTDAKGSDDYNQTLSEKRARAVADWLVANAGIDLGRLITRGAGENNPVAPNTREDGTDSPEGRVQNRRVEITISQE
jgi:outer membrane protein OmpA-like peptidoglycan-associated protein